MTDMQKDQRATENQAAADPARVPYSPPTAEIQPLQMIVLGSVGGDSDSGSQLPT